MRSIHPTFQNDPVVRIVEVTRRSQIRGREWLLKKIAQKANIRDLRGESKSFLGIELRRHYIIKYVW